MIIDCHGHYTTEPKDLHRFRQEQIAAIKDKKPLPSKASLKMTYPNYGGALATAGNLVFLGESDGTFGAYDAKTLTQLWSFNIGTGINAPPITYSVNGKQFVAVLAGSRQNVNIYGLAPEIKNMAPASMLYVFAL